MTAEQFAYWLQGYAELNASPPSAEQWQAIRDHLALVFNKVTPDYDWNRRHLEHPAPLDIERIYPGGPLKVTCTRTVC